MNDCKPCNGTGFMPTSMDGWAIFGITAALFDSVRHECPTCDGTGKAKEEEPPENVPSVCLVNPW